MTRPFEGIRIIDITHVLAGPFAVYQLAVLGADVIKVEHPGEPDQTRGGGTDRELNRPGAFAALGLGYEAMAAINPRLIYCSISAFGQDGPRGSQTAYDHVIQATSGLMSTTGTPEVNPIKFGSPAVDYATGTMGAFALASALFQRERTGRGQRIDLAMLDVAMILMSSHLTGFLRNGVEPLPSGNRNPHATNSSYQTKDGLVSLGASNLGQQRRLWHALERPDMVKDDNEARERDRDREAAVLADIMKTRTADEWEHFLQAHHVPAARVRRLAEAVHDPQFATRGVTHHHKSTPGVEGEFDVPLAAFKFAHGGPSIERPPPLFGADTEAVLAEHGYDADQIAGFRRAGVI